MLCDYLQGLVPLKIIALRKYLYKLNIFNAFP